MADGKAALNTADNISKLSQKKRHIGRVVIACETHRRAAEAGDRDGRRIGGANRSFSCLGVSVKDAAGQLRPAEEFLLDLADAFAVMHDGAG